ncbi:hypothetical protein E2C01_024487 [Portunus trituberculatus]|uniref:Uncharacterized protein n=1 Tax=Portunus trituberculatus TaxID=210409 RepID=A0A5B7EEV4_PORTR|nr:hypothetical protein [Portunus trituberculatus]
MVMGQANQSAAATVNTTHGRLEALTPTVWMTMATNMEKLLPSQTYKIFHVIQTLLVQQKKISKDQVQTMILVLFCTSWVRSFPKHIVTPIFAETVYKVVSARKSTRANLTSEQFK